MMICIVMCVRMYVLPLLKHHRGCINTPDRRQSKTILLSANVDQKSLETDFDCHLSPDWRQMAIENSVSIDFFYQRSSIFKRALDCRLSGVIRSDLKKIYITRKTITCVTCYKRRC